MLEVNRLSGVEDERRTKSSRKVNAVYLKLVKFLA